MQGLDCGFSYFADSVSKPMYPNISRDVVDSCLFMCAGVLASYKFGPPGLTWNYPFSFIEYSPRFSVQTHYD